MVLSTERVAGQGARHDPLAHAEVVFLLKSGVSPARVRSLVERLGISFEPSEGTLELVKAAGGDAGLLEALRAARPARPQGASLGGDSLPPGSKAGFRRSPLEPEMVLIRKGPAGDFRLSRFEVTNAQYHAFCRRSGRPAPKAPFWGTPDDFPVVNVTWHDALTFSRWLWLETGRRYRLPTDREWEFAASGGRSLSAFPWGDDDPVGRSCFAQGVLCRIGSFPPTAFGLRDMAGSVWEWCRDPFGKDEKERVIRGGSWTSPAGRPELLVVSHREGLDPAKMRNDVGFRVARDP